jgi:large subunit ribosomal protein L25
MADVQTLTAEPRSGAGTGAARALRREGKVPGVIYGPGQRTVAAAFSFDEIAREAGKRGFFQRLYDVALDGRKHRVLPREVQLHPVTDRPTHVDFQFISAGAKVRVLVGVQFQNEGASPGLKRGGVLNIVRREIEVTCPATAIPEAITVDLTGLDIGASVHISHITLPEGVKPTITTRDFTVATIVAPTVTVEATPAVAAAEGAEDAAAEGAAPAAAADAKAAG